MTTSKSVRTIPLDAVRADGWFERLGGGSAAFAQLCQIVGDRFVAFSIVAGLRITALQVDGRNPERSNIEFGLGEEGATQRMTLGDFRRRLANALIAEEEPPAALGDAPGPEELQAFLGVRNVLLAPVLGIVLLELRVPASRELPVRVACRIDDLEADLTVDELRELVRDRIRTEADRYRSGAPFAIDLAAIPEAEAAAREGRPERVVSLLGGWPGPLSMILRTPEGQQVGDEARRGIVRALGLLGSAYATLGRSDWAEDVLRLGIQWGGDGSAGADLFRRLGEAHLLADRAGEAIGLLRRALALWDMDAGNETESLREPRALTHAALARAFVARGRHVAALVCLERARENGATDDELAPIRDKAQEAVGDHWARLRTHLDEP
ncbi:MAG: tetratricopeptide repeat protein [Sandaracinaceae bacterium]|nr:tetratricopeptide repeat protein [Sandaracinaceae bacterium]